MRLASATKLSRWTLLVSLSACLSIAISPIQAPLAHSESAGPARVPDIIFVQAPTVVTGELTKRFPHGSHLVRLVSSAHLQNEINLTPDFFAAADPRVSSDTSRVIFSGKKTAEAPWQIWEMNADGSSQRQITRCDADCLRPAYLPDGEVVYSMIAGTTQRVTSTLYVSKADGSAARRITFSPVNFQVETVLRDGRILVSADSTRTPATQGRAPRSLYTLRTDGTGLSLFRSGSKVNLFGTGADELENGAVLFVSKDVPEGRSGGELAWIPPGASNDSRITPPQSAYWSAHELDGELLVVSRRSATPPSKVSRYDLYTFNLASRTIGKLIYRNPNFSSVQAVPVEPHPEPKRYLSILHPQQQTGRVLCLNAYLSADVPGGRLSGQIGRARVLMLDPDGHREVNLGEAPVESDGSFYVSVPADRPIRFELLSADGRVMRAQRSWVWTRRGEDMGCAGCHDDKAQAPANHWPLVLNRFDMPIPLGESSLAKTTGR